MQHHHSRSSPSPSSVAAPLQWTHHVSNCSGRSSTTSMSSLWFVAIVACALATTPCTAETQPPLSADTTTTGSAYTLTTLSGVGHFAGVRSVATVRGQGGAVFGGSIFFSTLRAANSTVARYELSSGAVHDIVHSSQYTGCLDQHSPTEFSATYPITPNAIAVTRRLATGSSGGNSTDLEQLYIADRTPSTHVYQINSTTSSFQPTTSTYALLIGATNCTGEVSPLSDGAATSSLMKDSTYLAVDSRTGTLYFTQRNAVFAMQQGATNVHYYFGNEAVAGNRSTEPYGPVPRLQARTDAPAQIAIDEVGDAMYVAEQGMGTVRQIDMATGMANVLIGKFESYTFPPMNCLVNACVAENVTFTSVVAVALYRAKSVPERWLFIGDFTGAVIYRMVLETGVVTQVAGSMLESGTIDGPTGVSKLFAVRSLAAGDSAIYIADGSLRKLELNDNPTKAPPVISPTVVEGTTTAVVVSTLVVGVVSPTGATQASRANVILSLARCERSFGDLPIFTHLLQFGVGDDEEFKYFTGAIVGNVLLCLATVTVNIFVVFAYARLAHKSVGEAASSLKFPSLVSLPLLFVLEPTISVGVTLMAYASGWMLALGVVGFLLGIVAFGAITVYFVFIFDGHNDFELLDKKFSGVIARMINPVGEWLPTDLTGRMGLFFEDYLPQCWWFIVVELGMCVMSGVLEGIRPEEESNCIAAIGLAAVLYTAFFAATVLYQPYTVRLTFYIRAVIAGTQMLSTYLSLAAVKTDDRDWEAAGVSLALLSLYVTTIDAMFSLLITVRDIFEFFQAQGGTVDIDVPLRVMDRQSSTGSNDSIVLDGKDVLEQREDVRGVDDFDDERFAANGVSRHVVLREHISQLMTHGEAAERYLAGSSAGATSPHEPFELGVKARSTGGHGTTPAAAGTLLSPQHAGRQTNSVFGVDLSDVDDDDEPPPPPPLPDTTPRELSNASMSSRRSAMMSSFAASREAAPVLIPTTPRHNAAGSGPLREDDGSSSESSDFDGMML